MIDVVKTGGILIPDTFQKIEQLKEHLAYNGQGWDGNDISFKMYEEVENLGILIPRFFSLQDYGDFNIINQSCNGDDIYIESNIKPRSKRQKQCINHLLESDNTILQLETGCGKTVITIDSICKYGKKTIIFVNKDSLRENWKDEFLLHTNITKEKLAFLDTKKYKDQLKCPIVISTVQAFIACLKKDGFKECFESNNFGVAVFDECHSTVGPEQFSKVSLNVNCNKIIGLSATPFRFDCNELLNWHMGEITYFPPNEDDNIVKPVVYVYKFSFGVYSNFKIRRYIEFSGNFNYSRYYKKLKDSKQYIDKVVSLIKRVYNANRISLVLGNNISVLLKMVEMSNLPKEKVGIFIPGTTPKQRLMYSDEKDILKAFKTKQIIFSTYQACRDGNNRKDLDCLIMTIPTSNVIQAGGRILRQLENKPTPIIIDLVDIDGPERRSLFNNNKVNLFERAFEKRTVIYNELGWEYKLVKENLKK